MTNAQSHSAWSTFVAFLRLGLTSFGGPTAHLAYFRNEFVTRRGWLSERSYADLVALCQFLPGPASSQVGIALGLSRSGYPGAFTAWLGFTLPSAVFLMIFALGLTQLSPTLISSGALRGLEATALAVIAQAVWGMSRQFCTSPLARIITLMAAAVVWLIPAVAAQIGVIVAAGVFGVMSFAPTLSTPSEGLNIRVSRRTGMLCLMVFAGLLLLLPALARMIPHPSAAMLDVFYRTGSLVFGGGHVVLPLLHAEIIPRGWLNNDTFMAGYGMAQAVPGPLFTFAAFLGTSADVGQTGWLNGVLCLLAIFAPSFLLVFGVLPFWEYLRQHKRMQAALMGINAAVVGLLLAVVLQQLHTTVFNYPQYLGLTVLAFAALTFWKLPPWLVVIGGSAVNIIAITFMNH